MKTLYFDYNATTPVAPEVFRAMEPFLRDDFGNAASAHQLSRNPAKALRQSRRSVAALLGASDDSEIVFTSGGTESNNAAIRAALANNPKRKRIITTAIEHSSVLKLCRQLAKEGYDIVELGVDAKGELLMDEFLDVLNDETALVSIMWANNETGVIFPIEEIATRAKAKGALIHVDAVQAVGKLPMKLSSGWFDYVALSAHKFYGPKGTGALFVRKGIIFHPLIFGGSQERGRRAGTENVPGIAGLGAACELVTGDFVHEMARLEGLRDSFEKILTEKIPDIRVNGRLNPRIPNTSNICFEGVDAETLLIALDQKGICVSMGSACMSGANEPSHVLKAMGLSDASARSSLRFSIGRYTDQNAITELIHELENQVIRIRSMNQNPGEPAKPQGVGK